MAEQALKAVVPAIGVSLNIPVGPEKESIGLVFQTHLPGDASQEEIDTRLDRFFEHAKRQQAIGRIPGLEKEVAKFRFNIGNLEDDIVKLDKQAQEKYEQTGRTGSAKLSATDKAARENALVNVDRYKEMLKTIEQELADAVSLRDGAKVSSKKAAA